MTEPLSFRKGYDIAQKSARMQNKNFCSKSTQTIQENYLDTTEKGLDIHASTVGIIDLCAIRHNYKLLQSFCRASCQIAPVVKANAYGLGALPIVETLAQEVQGVFLWLT